MSGYNPRSTAWRSPWSIARPAGKAISRGDGVRARTGRPRRARSRPFPDNCRKHGPAGARRALLAPDRPRVQARRQPQRPHHGGRPDDPQGADAGQAAGIGLFVWDWPQGPATLLARLRP
jgi:DNA ligase (NAD+)